MIEQSLKILASEEKATIITSHWVLLLRLQSVVYRVTVLRIDMLYVEQSTTT